MLQAIDSEIAKIHADLNKAVTDRDQLSAQESAAVDTAAAHAAWKERFVAASDEVLRLERKLAKQQAERDNIIHAEFTRRRDDQLKKNKKLAARLAVEGNRAVAVLLSLVEEVAKNDLETEEINRLTPHDEPAMMSADEMARLTPGLPQKTIDEKNVELWVCEANGQLVDQPSVIQMAPDRGYIQGARNSVPVVKRPFLQRRYNPQEATGLFKSLYRALSLPHFDSAEMAWDGEKIAGASSALRAIEDSATPVRRTIKTDFIPLIEEVQGETGASA